MVQAVGVLLHEEPEKRTAYMRILKLLIIADRESLRRTGYPIIGSKVVAMKNGPLHSVVYDLIKAEHPDVPMWESFFTKVSNFDIQMCNNPGVDELSRFEVALLRKVSHKHAWLDAFELSDLTHKFSDWERAWKERGERGSVPIPLEETLNSLGLEEEADTILEDVKAHNLAVNLLS